MIYTIEHEGFTLSVSSLGAEPVDWRSKANPSQPLLWDANPDIWARHAPVCFPLCGGAPDGEFLHEGNTYRIPRHGFARDMEHRLVAQESNRLVFELHWSGDDSMFPWPFSFTTEHMLDGASLITTCTATSTGDEPMPAQLGFHPALRCPFAGGDVADYQIRFQLPEALDGTDIFSLEEHKFVDDSIQFPNLRSQWIQLEHIETGKYLRVATEGFPFVLLWSKPGIPGFVCIEPWGGAPSNTKNLFERPSAQSLGKGQQLSYTQHITANL